MKKYEKIGNVMVNIISAALCIWMLISLVPFIECLFKSTWIDVNTSAIRMTLNDGSLHIMPWKYIWWLVKGPTLTFIVIYAVMTIAEAIIKFKWKEN